MKKNKKMIKRNRNKYEDYIKYKNITLFEAYEIYKSKLCVIPDGDIKKIILRMEG